VVRVEQADAPGAIDLRRAYGWRVPTDYEPLAARYDEDRAKFSYSQDDVIAELLATRRSVCVVDVGCGTGRWLEAQRDLFSDPQLTLFGVDPSAAMLAEAGRKAIANLVIAPAEYLPFASATVDYIVSAYCFHHFTDKERALDEVRRVLTAGGVFRVNNIEPFSAQGGWLYELFPETVAIDAARFWSPSRLGEGLEQRGFAVDIEIDSESQEIPAAEALADAERRVISQLAVLDDAAYARGLARLRQVAASSDATFAGTLSRLHLTARRV
jgi:SAM-dependent methyltransferase